MGWFPKFLNPWAALAAAAVFIPLLLVLYFLKLRRRQMDVPSTLLWRKAIQDLQVNAPFQKLRRNLLLLLQLLLLLFLLLALSRPVSNYTPGPGKTTVLLIDRSASMGARDQEGGRSRLDEAKERAKRLVAAMGKNSTAMVIAFDESAEMLQPFTSDAQLLNAAIDGVRQTDRRTDVKLAFQLAEAQVNFNPEQLRANVEPPDVRVFSDGRVLNVEELRLKGSLTLEKVGSDDAGNIAIVALSAKRNYERPTQVQVFARLANFGAEPVSAPVQLSIDGQAQEKSSSDLQTTFLLPERWDEAKRSAYEKETAKSHRDGVEFKLELTQAAVIKLEQLNKDKDLLAADDTAQVVVPPPKALSVLLVTDGNYFLERAIKSLNLKAPDIIRPQAYEDEVPTKYDVILFDNYKPPVDPDTKKPRLPEAGNFIWFGQVPDGIKTKIATTGGAPAGATRPAGAPPAKGGTPVILEDVRVLDWKRDHPMLRELSFNKLYAAAALKLEVPLDQEVLIDGLKGPLVVLDREGKSTHLLVAFDLMQSDWPLRVSFPIFLQNALQFLAVGSDMDVRQSIQPGASPRIPRPNLLKVDPNLPKVALHLPNGGVRDVPVPAAGDFVLPPLEKVGLYTTEPPVPQYEQIAVNLLDANESNLRPNENFATVVGGAVQEGGDQKKPLELWWWLALAALALLMVEWWVYTRRVHL